MRHSRLSTSFLVWIAFGFSVAQVQAQFAAKWREEAPQGWRKLEACLGGLEARLTVSDVTRSADPEQRRPLDTKTAIVKLAADRGLVQAGSTKSAEVWGFNPSYGFRLANNGQPKAKWELAFAGAVGNETTDAVPLDIHYSDASRFLRAPWQLAISPLTLLIESPYFKVLSATDGPARNGVRVVDLRFTFSPPDKPAPRSMAEMTWLDTPMRSGTVSLAPELSWAIVGYDLTSKGGGQSKREVSYGGLVDGLPRLRRVVDRMGDRTLRCEITEWERREIPPEEFTLTAYGQPEFVGARNHFFSRPAFWLITIAILLLGLAVWLKFVRQRRLAG